MTLRPLTFGISIVPNAEGPGESVDLVKRADALGRIWNIPAPALDTDEWAAQLANRSERYGVDTFVIWTTGASADADQHDQAERLAAAREAIGAQP